MASCQGKRPECLPPRLNEVEVSCPRWDVCKLPTGMRQHEEQHFVSVVDVEVVEHCNDFGRRANPGIYQFEELQVVFLGALFVGPGERFTGMWLECAKDVAPTPASWLWRVGRTTARMSQVLEWASHQPLTSVGPG